MYGFIVVILISAMAVVFYKQNLFHRTMAVVLKPFGLRPGEFFEKLGVVGTVLASAFVRNPEELYNYIGDQPGLGKYLNLGWWDHGPIKDWNKDDELEMKENCDELVRKVANLADIDDDDQILDVGFGFGEQDILLADEFEFQSLVGINITYPQVKTARDRARNNGFDNMNFLKGDAVKLPFKDNSFDKILAIESPFHFRTRDQFFDEAHRVLRSEGTLVTADIIYKYPPGDGPLEKRIFEAIHDWYWQVPEENHSTPSMYKTELENHGFRNVDVNDVTDNVIVPGIITYIYWRANTINWAVRTMINPILNWGIDFYESGHLRYVLSKSKK